jgi:hypothetical protein
MDDQEKKKLLAEWLRDREKAWRTTWMERLVNTGRSLTREDARES